MINVSKYWSKLWFKLQPKHKQEKILRYNWHNENIYYGASSINYKYAKFKHIIPIDYYKCYSSDGFTLVKDLKSYTYPNRPLNDCTIITSERGFWYKNDFIFNEIGGGDQLFAITNNSYNAIIISLKYC